MENSLQNIIDYQISLHRGINLFHNSPELLTFSDCICKQVHNTVPGHIDEILEYITNQVLEEFYRVNQYYHFDKTAKVNLKKMYRNLYYEMRKGKQPEEKLARQHARNLQNWLTTFNSFACKVYPHKQPTVEAVACFEYEPELQLDLLRIDLSQIVEPVLDIGCGEQANLVQYLRSKGICAFGIERLSSECPYVENADWLDYQFEAYRWGTIISNLGFSNHFNHHHLRSDGDYMGYAKKYMEILHSLKAYGSFYYAPGLPFIEEFLDKREYKVTEFDLAGMDYKAVRVDNCPYRQEHS